MHFDWLSLVIYGRTETLMTSLLWKTLFCHGSVQEYITDDAKT